MSRKSGTDKLVQRTASQIPPTTEQDLARLRAAMEGPIDTSDIPEVSAGAVRVKRDAAGRLPVRPKSPIRDAILAALGRRRMTRYELWKRAQAHCPRLPQSAVYEYLRGGRAIGAPYLEALFAAAGLQVAPVKTPRATEPKKPVAPKRRPAKLVTR